MDLAALAQSIASQYEHTTGVPSRIGEVDTVLALLEAVEAGNYLETAADLADIDRSTLSRWQVKAQDGKEPYQALCKALKRAAARAEAAEVAKVRRAGNDPRFWAASMTYLERRAPDRWARRAEDTNTPRVLVQVGVQGNAAVQVQLEQAYAESDK
jgi:hypothetical protein